jgi:hypothetical protein
LIHGAGVILMTSPQVAVLIPPIRADIRAQHFDESDAALNEPAGQQTLPGE